jgi:hypothetical protein
VSAEGGSLEQNLFQLRRRTAVANRLLAMSIVQFRSDSPYVPRPIGESTRGLSERSSSLDARFRRVLVVGGESLRASTASALGITTLAAIWCRSGHRVDLLSLQSPPALDAHIRLLDRPPARRQGLLTMLASLSGPRPSNRLDDWLERIAQSSSLDYDVVVDDQTLSPALGQLKCRGLRIFSMITEPDAIPRASYKLLRELDGLWVSSSAALGTCVDMLGIDSQRVTLINRDTAPKLVLT